jgi:hypothetical protein
MRANSPSSPAAFVSAAAAMSPESNPQATPSVENQGCPQWKDPSRGSQPYLVADIPGSKVVFDIEVGNGGRAEMYSMRSKGFGLGMVKCWMDEKAGQGVTVVGYWDNH